MATAGQLVYDMEHGALGNDVQMGEGIVQQDEISIAHQGNAKAQSFKYSPTAH